MRMLGSVLAGGLLVTGFPPFGWAPVAWVGAGLFIWLAASAETRGRALAIGYLVGIVSFSGIMWWLVNVELIAFYPLMIVEAFSFVVIAWVAHRYRDATPLGFALAVGGGWGLAEFLRVRWPFGGFPWGTLGLSIVDTPLRASAQWIGASGWSVVLATIAALAVAVGRRRAGRRALLLVVGATVAVAWLGLVFPATADGDVVRVAIVQGNSPCPGSRCPDERRLIYESHLALTASIPPGSVDLVVWPESSTGFSTDPTANAEIATAIGDQARRIGAYLLVGGDRADGPDGFINSNVVFSPDGEMVGAYVKNHPVPYGEYVPFRPLVDWIPAIDRVPRDARAGDGPVRFDLAFGSIGSVISYEGAFARYERATVRLGAELLVVATNEASYGRSPASDQFLAISRVRAAEFGTDIVQGAVTGRSAVARANGPLTGPTDLFTATVLFGEARLRTAGPTLYTTAGDWLQILAILALGARLVADRRGQVAAPGVHSQQEGHPGGWPSFTGSGN